MTASRSATSTAQKRVYLFGAGKADGSADMKDLLGGKGANLAEMASLGLPVPPGFTITTEVCTAYYANGRILPDGLKGEVEAALAEVGKAVGARFGDAAAPLLVSVRSGARASMPGMMDTILNLGLNDETVEGLAAKSGNPRFAYDSYRRFIQMYSNVVLGVEHGVFEDILESHKNLNGLLARYRPRRRRLEGGGRRVRGRRRARDRQAVPPGYGRAAVGRHRRGVRLLAQRAGQDLPPPARHPRRLGHGRQRAGHGVRQPRGHARPPASPSRAIPRPARARSTASSSINAQGEDVVAGIRTPQPLTEAARKAAGEKLPSLEALMPAAFAELAARVPGARSAATATCRTSSSPSRRASSGCCRRGRASAPPRPPSRSPPTSWPTA